MIDTNALVGILSGSLATLVIKEILNQINKRQDFTRELKKVTYTRKLEKAENAIAYYWTYLNKVIEMKKSLEVIIKAINEFDEKENDVEFIQQIMTTTSQALTDLAGDKYSNVNAIHLYFDLEDNEKWNENDIENLLKYLAETKAIDNEIQFWTDWHNHANKLNDIQQSDIYWNKAISLLPTYVSSLQNVINCIEKNKTASKAIINSIKRQLKQY
jgi:hypothetical protein